MKYFKYILEYIWAIYNLPAFIFHELCHITAIIILFPFVHEIVWKDCLFIFKLRISNYEINCKIAYRADALAAIFISAAPVIGWLIAYVYLCVTNNLLWLYFCWGPCMHFWLSPIDKQAVVKNWNLLFNKNKNEPKTQEPQPKAETK